jgi:hypothetical protein
MYPWNFVVLWYDRTHWHIQQSGMLLWEHPTSLIMAPFRAPASETNSASHAYRICQLTNGRAGSPVEICIKDGSPGCEDSFNTCTRKRRIKKGETTPDCLAMMSRGPGTTPLSTACFLVALRPAMALASAATIAMVHRPVSWTSSGAPSLTPDWTSLHRTATPLSTCSRHRLISASERQLTSRHTVWL